LYFEGKEYTFDGIINGKIADVPRGKEGFGYDSVFEPSGYSQTFAEMTESEKNAISHRALAMAKLMTFLNSVSKM
jgi:XTP/dITP diphosphohydrolase